ncbi:hypothetical protein, partial [Herbaspirillum lusitanum]|uniref:hypothetical protein n=1 Tax=Herbaspirillum lusitanum TaxID=213312 RepID=UPI001EE6836C
VILQEQMTVSGMHRFRRSLFHRTTQHATDRPATAHVPCPDAAWLAAIRVHDMHIDLPVPLAASATVHTARRPDLPLPGLAAGAVCMPSMEQLPMKGSSQT